MSSNDNSSKSENNKMDWKKTLIICCIILFVGTIITVVIFSTEPTAKRVTATKQTAMLVDVIKAERGTFRPTIAAMGTVEPAQDIILSPRVSGEIIKRSPSFTPGGIVEKGETLLQIDPADYQNALQQRKSDLHQATADLNIEMGRQDVALKDYQLLDENLSSENKELVLREPQLNAARARVEAARAAVQQAELNLQRTTVKAPFDAHILHRNVNLGSQVSPGDNLGRLVGLDTYWVATTCPLSKLQWLSFPDNTRKVGSEVQIRNRNAWPEGIYRTGHLYKLVGALDEQTRMARVLVSVQDPLAHQTNPSELPALMIGSFVETRIQGKKITDVIRLNRDYVRKNDTVWIMKDGKLHIRNIDIIFRDANYAYIKSGLNKDEQVITTNLSTVTDGAPLRLQSTDTTSTQVSVPADTLENQDTTQTPGGAR